MPALPSSAAALEMLKAGCASLSRPTTATANRFSGKTKGKIHPACLITLTVSISPGCKTSIRARPRPAPARRARAASSTRTG